MSLLQQAPRFERAAASAIARDLYGLDSTASLLPSERDQNFLLQCNDGRRFVLKIANATESRALLDAQNDAMAHLAHTGLCPSVVRMSNGELVGDVTSDGTSHFVRLLTWIPGIPLGDVRDLSPALPVALGGAIASVSSALRTFDHPAVHRAFHWDLARGLETVHAHLPLIPDRGLRALVEQTAAAVERETRDLLPRLRRSVVHNDANDHNIVVSRDPSLEWRVAGLIDFGDIVHSYAVADLAVAVAYAVLGKSDPLAVAVAIVSGYNAVEPLPEEEISALFGLVRLRLAMSVCIAAWQTAQRPDDPYLSISQAAIERTLPQLQAISPRFALAAFRRACGMSAATRVTAVPRSPVLDGFQRPLILDLSVASPLVSADPRENVEAALTRRIGQRMTAAGADLGIGRYGEPRLLYSTPLFAAEDAASERRTIHLGIDLFAPAGTPIMAPLDGTVHIVANNDAPLDYGPLVILQHRSDSVEPFYTLYGHLGRDVLGTLHQGQKVAAGEPFATIGDAEVNGGWTPHLHFQVITDLLGLDAGFPGVCRASEREVWKAFSPDPGKLLGITGAAYPDDRLDVVSALADRRTSIGSNLSVGYRTPIAIARGWMQYLFDDTGRRFLDAYNNVPHVGHCHPRVVQAVSDQLRVLNTNTRYLHESLARYAERLTSTLPAPLRVCYFVNSGSEANELALRLARAFTGRRALVVLDAAYHGNTTTLIDISPYKFNGPGGLGAPPWVHVVALPDVYRGEFRGDDAGKRYADQVKEAVTGTLGDGPNRLCGFIAETCPSVAGQVVLPPGYLEGVYRDVRAAGGLCIADEVQTAYGRMGSHFYAFEAHGVVPDIVVLGKPIGNGYPLGAVITTPEIAASFDTGMEFFSTFGGSTASCAAGLAVLDVVQEEGLQAHAQRVGDRMLAGLAELRAAHEIIGDVRGSGFFLGVDLVLDRDTRAPAPAHAALVVNRLREAGVLIGTDGAHHNVLKIRPPMPFAQADADLVVETLDRVLSQIA